jgi:tetratricopeptide (TPR) repeat protein
MQPQKNRGSARGSGPAQQARAALQRGLALQRDGRLDQAIAALTIATRLGPDPAEALGHLGTALHRAGRLVEAVTAWQRSLALRPDHADTIAALCRALLAAGRAEEAAIRLSAAHRHHPGDARLLTLNGQALLALGRTKEAIGALMVALDLQPGQAAAHARLVAALNQAGDIQQALHHSMEAFRLDPSAVHASMLSGVLCNLCHYDEALVFASHALLVQPDHVEALVNRALALDGLGQAEAALAAGWLALAVAPDNDQVRYHQAERLLSQGQLTAEAWALYEARLALKGNPAPATLAVWDGGDITGRTILLHAEQGLGDTLHFVRYAPLVAARAGRVILAVQPPLLRLLHGVPGVDQVVAAGGALPAFDVVCPLLSLPRIFATGLLDIPPSLPYAGTPQPWDDDTTGLRVGLVWAGNAGFVHDRHRSVPPAELAALAGLPGVQFYSLQRHEGLPVPLPPELGAIDLMLGVTDFADTAALIAGLDLVISVDTAVAHLAASMGKPVWMLSRFRGCWRWMQDRGDSPWYPSLRIIRQAQPHDWSAPLAHIRDDLAGLAAPPARHGPRRASPPPPRACKACAAAATAIGVVDFNKSCEDLARPAAPADGRRVTYHRCPDCALVFTGDFDGWSQAEFAEHIYNDGYAAVDPDYAMQRPAASAALIGQLFGEACRGMEVLDYGGGEGVLAAMLRDEHGMVATSYDPFTSGFDVLPQRSFPLVTCFEVLEHSPGPRATIQALAGLVAADGMVVFSTLVQPADFARHGVGWWYVAPRNGHVTVYSRQALKALWAEAGFEMVSHSDNLHLAARVLPPIAARFAGQP